ncbi:MAG: 16S rRNA (uracil(1498)-N(3))-methyltransferase, partial [Pirellulaceae bacterium]
QIKRSSADLEIRERRNVSRESRNDVVLGVALPRSDRQRWLIEKAVELGVAEVVPLITSRGVALRGEGARKRLERTVIEASKQCCRNALMRIAEPLDIEEFLAAEAPDAVRWIAHPGSLERKEACPVALTRQVPSPVARVAIGPEGGFTDAEIALAVMHQWQMVDLGPRVLRVETAALAIASLLLLGT